MAETRYEFDHPSRDDLQLLAELAALGLPGLQDVQSSLAKPASVWAVFADALSAPQQSTLSAAVAAHSPDPAAPARRLRAAADAMLSSDPSPAAKAQRAVALAALSELNSLRSWVTSFVAQVALSTSLANFQARVAALPAMPQRTKAQLLAAAASSVDSGDAD